MTTTYQALARATIQAHFLSAYRTVELSLFGKERTLARMTARPSAARDIEVLVDLARHTATFDPAANTHLSTFCRLRAVGGSFELEAEGPHAIATVLDAAVFTYGTVESGYLPILSSPRLNLLLEDSANLKIGSILLGVKIERRDR